VHLSRLAEDLILWSTEEFGIIELDDAFATGSSLMPQKKNPDVLELVRGQTGVVVGAWTALVTMLKGLPLAYNRDLQWDKASTFQAVDAVDQALEVVAPFVRSVRVRPDRAARLLASDTICATDVAEYLVRRGVPFRKAHGLVGQLVLAAERTGRRLKDVTVEERRHIAPELAGDLDELLDPQVSVDRKQSWGSTHPRHVAAMIRRWQVALRRRAPAKQPRIR
jgi:argininosuccinate lyase